MEHRIKQKKRKINVQRALAPYLFVLPNFLIFFIFVVIPAAYGLYFSFTNYDGLSEEEFVGFTNYIKLFGDGDFWETMLRTAIYSGIVVPTIYILALGVAILLIKEVRFKGIFRAIIYWPTMISFIVVGVTWKWIFGDTFGIINYLMELGGKQGVPWLSESFYATLVVIIATLWSRIGFFMVIFISGLQSIPGEFYEAASIDGAKRWQMFYQITLPLLKPTSVMVIMLAIIDSFKAYPLIVSLTGGGPGRATTYLVQYIYRFGFEKNQLGYASAMSVVLFLIILITTSIQFKANKGGEI